MAIARRTDGDDRVSNMHAFQSFACPHCRVSIVVYISGNRYVGPLPVNQAWLKFHGGFPQGKIGEEGI